MKAAVFQGPSAGLVIEDRPIPTPGPREVIVKVHRCGICGTDLHFTNGEDFLQAPAGAILGHEYAGEVVDIGSDVDRLAVGDRITALAAIAACGQCDQCVEGDLQWCTGDDRLYPASGAYAQFAPVAEPQVVKLPGQLSLADAALIEPLAVGLHGCSLAELSHGANVLILGAGPIGLAVAIWARRLGARRIVVQARSRRREDSARALGTTDFITCGDNPVAAALESLGGPPDVVFEAAGMPGSIEQAMQTVRPRGTVVVLGWCGVPDSYVPALYLMKGIRLPFSITYSRNDFRRVTDALDGGLIEPRAMITDTIALDELPVVFERLRADFGQHCKVLVDPWR